MSPLVCSPLGPPDPGFPPTIAPMHTPVDFPAHIAAALAQLHYGEKPDTLYAPIRYIMGLGGKPKSFRR